MMLKRQKNWLPCEFEALTMEVVHKHGKDIGTTDHNSCQHASFQLPGRAHSSVDRKLCTPMDEELTWDYRTTATELVQITEDQLASSDQQFNDALKSCNLFDTDDNIAELEYEDFIDDMIEDDTTLELSIDEKKRAWWQNAFKSKLPVNVFETENVSQSGNESVGLLANDDTGDNKNEGQTAEDFDIGNNTHEKDPFGNHNYVPTDANAESISCFLLFLYMLLLLICVYSIIIIS